MKRSKEYLEKAAALAPEKTGNLRGRRGAELELWNHWNNNGRQEEHLEPLLASFEPVIEKETTSRLKGLGGTMPKAALKAEIRFGVAKSLGTYDPSRGTQLFTHVMGGMQRVSDAVNRARNPSHLPRKITSLYQPHESARLELTETLGREPTPEEILPLMPPGTDLRTLKRLRSATRGEVFTNMGEEFDERPKTMGVRDAYGLLKPAMTEPERQFVELHYAADGSSMPIKGIAKAMGLPPHSVYRLKTMVENKLDSVLKKA